MKAKLLQWAIGMILGMLNVETIKKVADAALDFVEQAVEKSESKVDDQLVLPALATLREAFAIPDNDAGVEAMGTTYQGR